MTVYSKSMMEALAEVRGLQEDNMDLMRKAAGGAAQKVKFKDKKSTVDSFIVTSPLPFLVLENDAVLNSKPRTMIPKIFFI